MVENMKCIGEISLYSDTEVTHNYLCVWNHERLPDTN